MGKDGSAWETASKVKARKSRKKAIVTVLGIGLVAIVVLLLFAPKLVSPVVRSMVVTKGSEAIDGSIGAQSVSLSWFGPQRVRGLTIDDPDGQTVVNAEIKVDSGLIGLALGGLDLGEVRVSGSAQLERDASGQLNLMRAVGNRSGSGSGGATGTGTSSSKPSGASSPTSSSAGSIPESLRATVHLDGLRVSYVDPSITQRGLDSIVLDNVRGQAQVGAGTKIEADFSAKIGGVSSSGQVFESGIVSGSGTVDGLISADGTIHPDKATILGTAKTDDLDPALADRLFDAPVSFAQAFASRVQVLVDVQGSAAEPSVQFKAESKQVHAEGAIGLVDGSIVTREPVVITLDREALDAIDPKWLDEVTGGSLSVRTMPSVQIQVDNVHIATDGKLGSAAGAVTLNLGSMEALVSVGEGEEKTRRNIATNASSISLQTEKLSEAVVLRGGMGFLVNGRDGGTLGIDLEAGGLVDDSGGVLLDRAPVLRGRVGLDGVDTGVIQPFVAAAGVNMGREIGPELSLGVKFEPQSGGDITLIHSSVESVKANGELNFVLEGTTLKADDPGGQVRLASIGPILTRLFREQGLRVRDGARVELTLTSLTADLENAVAGNGFGLGDLDASVDLLVGPTNGVIISENGTDTFAIDQVGAFIEFGGSNGTVQARLNTGGSYSGKPAGQVAAEFRLVNLIGENGEVGIPSAIAGRAELVGLSTELASALASSSKPGPSELLGPLVDLVLEATPIAGGKTKVIATITSDRLTGDGALLLSPTALEVDPEEGYTITHTGLSAALGSMVDLGETMTLRGDGGSAELSISRLSVPVDQQTRQLGMDKIDLAARAAVRNVYLDPADTNTDGFEVRQIVINPRLKPGTDPKVRLAIVGYSGRSKVEGEGTLTVPGLIGALAGTNAWTPGALAPAGTISFDSIPEALLARAIAMSGLEGLDADAVARDIAGEGIELEITMAPRDNELGINLQARGQRLSLSGDAQLGEGFESAGVKAEVKLSRPSTTNILESALPNMTPEVSIVGTTALRLDATLDAAGALDARALIPTMVIRGLDEQDVRVRVDTAAAQTGKDETLNLKGAVSFESASRTPIGSIDFDFSKVEQGLGGTLTAKGLRTQWADRFLGTVDLYSGLLGAQVGISGTFEGKDDSTTTLRARIQAPTLTNASELAVQIDQGALALQSPFTARWDGDRDWLNGRLSRSLGESAFSVDQDLAVDLTIRSFTLPSQDAAGTPLSIDAVMRIDKVGLILPGGQSRKYSQVQIVSRSTDDGTGAKVIARGDVQIDENEPVRAISLSADIHDLAGGSVLTLDKAWADVVGHVEHVPTPLVDALAGTDGWLGRMLGDEVAIRKLSIKRAPLNGGTASMDLISPNAQAHLAGTFLEDGQQNSEKNRFFVLDEGGFIELSKLNEEFTKKIFATVPIFASLTRNPDSDRPSRIDLRSGRVPLGGSIEDMQFDLGVDLGTVRYDLSGPIQTALKITGQKNAGQVGARMSPFDVRMAQGIINYENVAVPLGEFVFTSQGEINLKKKAKDLLVYMPVGAFAAEAFGAKGAAGLLDAAANIPMRNAGPLETSNWNPDFSKAFKPEKIFDKMINNGIDGLFKPKKNDKPGGGGGG